MPTVDMVRTGQNINRLRKQTGLSTAAPRHLQMAARRLPADRGQPGRAGGAVRRANRRYSGDRRDGIMPQNRFLIQAERQKRPACSMAP